MTSGILIVIIVLITFVYFGVRKSKEKTAILSVTKQIQLNELKTVINQLSKGELEYDFFGITSDGIDCLYFVENDGKINIEFEVMTNEQKAYVEKLKNFANKNNYLVIKLTYGNKPHYPELKEAPVYRFELNTDLDVSTEIGIEIMKNIFNKNENSKFDIVP